MREIWQTVVRLQGSSGYTATGLASQGTLWADANIFSRYAECGANTLMFNITNYALTTIKGRTYETPFELFDDLFPRMLNYGKSICNDPKLRKTFVLNSLVAVDNAAWLLYAHENGLEDFDEMIPSVFHPALPCHHRTIAAIPLLSYDVSTDEIMDMAHQGYFFFKIKIGNGKTEEEMLQNDKNRISCIHRLIGNLETDRTRDGKVIYYLDANSQYKTRECLLRLIDHLDKIDALKHVAVIEEPVAEDCEFDFHDIPVRIGADERIHTETDTIHHIEQGYSAIALKPIAKTLTMTLRVAETAWRNNVSCFCADLTVNPILLEWNKCFASRLHSFPGLQDMGLMESNGHQNYRNWNQMLNYSPGVRSEWTQVQNGMWHLNDDFYRKSGCIYEPSQHYELL